MAEARPKIGLVLSGGGARGAAHIGVRRYLEEQKIPIDVIAGTSMGAIIGGLYASGLSADEIEKITLELDWAKKLRDNVPRQERSIQRKRTEDIFSIGASPGIGKSGLKLPSGAIQGQNIILELQKITHHVSDINDFSKFPIPFKAVATDIVSGRAGVIESGSLAVAMRASMGVPGAFVPMLVDGDFLVDGGVTNNLPVNVAREMGADIVIAINIGSPLLTEPELHNIISVADQMIRMLTGRNVVEQLKTLGERDILIQPELGSISSGAFNKMHEVIEIGYQAAVETGMTLSDFEGVEAGDYNFSTKPEMEKLTIRKVAINNNSGLNDEVINNLVETAVGDELDISKLERELTRVHGLGNFQHVGYALSREDEYVDLQVNTIAKTWGPNYLHFGFDVETQFQNDSRTQFLVGFTMEDVTDTGSEWTTIGGLGDEHSLRTFWFQPLTYSHDWYFSSHGGYDSQIISDFDGDEKVAEFAFRQYSVYAGVGYEFGVSAAVQLGLTRIYGKADVSIGGSLQPNSEFDDGHIGLTYLYDTRNDVDFPSSGAVIDFRITSSHESLGSDNNYQQWELRTGKYFSSGAHNLGIAMNLGATHGESNVGSIFRVGGYGQLTGLRMDQLAGNYKGILSAIYYRRYKGIPALEGFIGSILEYGGAWRDREDISTDNSVASLGFFVGADTPVGTLQLGYALTDNGDDALFARIGRVF
jgi:NTE family protein